MSGARLHVRAVLAVVLISAVMVGQVHSAAAEKIKRIDLGVHSFSTKPGVPAGSARLNCYPQWRDVQPEKGTFDWAAFDATVTRYEQWGFSDIVFVFCATPKWAADKVKKPEKEVMGKHSTGAPKKIAYWEEFVTKVVKRYGNRFSGYQVWNEITSPQFWQGSPAEMAKMTKTAAKIIRNNSNADVISASVQTHVPKWFNKVAVPYFDELREQSWPVDAIAGHFYPDGKGGPNDRIELIKKFKKALDKANAPGKAEIWDTEANFWTSVKGNPKDGRVKGSKAATFLARNYLDGWRTGVQRSYWYLWSDIYMSFPGVQLRAGDAATKAFKTLGDWVIGAKFKGCKDKPDKLVVCNFQKNGSWSIAFTTKGETKLKISGTKQRCPVTGADCSKVKKSVKVGEVPIRLA